jgi:hypothetical protein
MPLSKIGYQRLNLMEFLNDEIKYFLRHINYTIPLFLVKLNLLNRST